MDAERAYMYLEHMRVMLEHGNVQALRLDDNAQRRCYANAIKVTLPILEASGVTVDRSVRPE